MGNSENAGNQYFCSFSLSFPKNVFASVVKEKKKKKQGITW